MIYRYTPTFFAALQQSVGRERPFPAFSRWANHTLPLLSAVYAAAEAAGFDAEKRRLVRLHLDKRDISMETILGTIAFHATREYPYLLGEKVNDNAIAVFALNLNDRYLIARLAEVEALKGGALGDALAALKAHLDSAPIVPS